MKNLLLISLLISGYSFGQASGNINAASSGNSNYNYNPSRSLNLPFANSNDLIIEVNGLSNIKADSYVAIFHVTQMAKSAEDLNDLLNARIDSVKAKIKVLTDDATVFVDMLTFVPVYEYTLEKKLFSKDTYNEIPKGFELKKNIHIHFTNAELLSDFISICTQSEIYDLVRVDYICNDLEQKKRELAEKAVKMVEEKVARFEGLLDVDFESLYKQVIEGFQVYYPVEQYKSYNAFSSASLDLKRSATVNNAAKPQTTYYQPVPNKAYDFVINPVVLEPVIQVIYQIKLKVVNPPKPKEIIAAAKVDKEYLLITNDGNIKKLQIGN